MMTEVFFYKIMSFQNVIRISQHNKLHENFDTKGVVTAVDTTNVVKANTVTTNVVCKLQPILILQLQLHQMLFG
jgi:hypothetical protein